MKIILSLALYLIVSIAFYNMFRKANIPKAWLAFIPIANMWPFMWAIQKSAWNILWTVVPIANLVFATIWMIRYLKAFGQKPWLVVLAYIPVVNIAFLIILLRMGFSSQIQYKPELLYNRQSQAVSM